MLIILLGILHFEYKRGNTVVYPTNVKTYHISVGKNLRDILIKHSPV